MTEKTVLLVDDEIHVLNALKRLLRNEDYNLVVATGGEEALAILETQSVELVVSDHRMPGMTGVQFLKTVKERRPDTVRVALSGYADVAVIVDAINHGEIFRFITKPWDDDELKADIRACLNHYDTLQQRRVPVAQLDHPETEG